MRSSRPVSAAPVASWFSLLALPRGERARLLVDLAAQPRDLLGVMSLGQLRVPGELLDARAEALALRGELLEDARLALGLGLAGGRCGLDLAALTAQRLDGAGLLIELLAQVAALAAFELQLALEDRDALDMGLEGPLDPLHVHVVLVERGHRGLAVGLGEPELAVPQLLLDPVLGHAAPLGEEPAGASAQDPSADDRGEGCECVLTVRDLRRCDPRGRGVPPRLEVCDAHHDFVRAGRDARTPHPLRPRVAIPGAGIPCPSGSPTIPGGSVRRVLHCGPSGPAPDHRSTT